MKQSAKQDEPCLVRDVMLKGENVSMKIRSDTIRTYDKSVVVASLVGTPNQIKAYRAWMSSPKTSVRLTYRGEYTFADKSFIPSEDGYRFSSVILEKGLVHLVAVSRTSGLILGNSEAHWWRFLTSDAVTTPMLREWVPYVMSKAKRFLVSCGGFGIDAHVFSKAEAIDGVVSAGLISGDIVIPEAKA